MTDGVPIAELGIPAPRLFMGMSAGVSANPEILPELYDQWVELGQTGFDSGRFYAPEPVLGRWLARRHDRERLVIVGKACHPLDYESAPRLTPEDLDRDLLTSLDVLGTGWLDILLVHRDDESAPVGPILEALARHQSDGRIRAYGASNWTTDRLAEAEIYARARGIPPFSISSPNLSLAVPVHPVWPGCVTAGDARSRAWYRETQLPLMAWTPLARGYFANAPSGHRDTLAAAAFDSPANLGRRARAVELATELGVTASQVALAWVLHQDFPTMAVIGPRTPAELEEAHGALTVALDTSQVSLLIGGEA